MPSQRPDNLGEGIKEFNPKERRRKNEKRIFPSCIQDFSNNYRRFSILGDNSGYSQIA
ncbi:MAG: hypothetical protein KAR20_28195 [Candidatus Heimdallarchaeota archaeon]|nr:hypothetical protein [Candidatus Heimdallarchaeota archaeon]